MIKPSNDAMTDVYVECRLPVSQRQQDGGEHNGVPTCLVAHRVQWLSTLERKDSNRVLCHFRAPDAESVRIALRNLNVEIGSLWIGDLVYRQR